MRLLYFGLESQNWVLSLVNEISKLGHKISVFTQNIDDYDSSIITSLDKNVDHYMDEMSIYMQPEKFIEKYDKILKKEKFDLVIGSHTPVSSLVREIGKTLDIPTSIMLLDIPTDFMDPMSENQQEKYRWIQWKNWFDILKDIDMILFNTTVARKEYARFTGKLFPKGNVIFYAVNTENMDIGLEVHEDTKLDVNNYVISSCRLNPYKKCTLIVEALSILKEKYNKSLTYVAIGRDNGDLKNIWELSKEKNINFKYFGLVPEYDKIKLIKESKALIYPQSTKYIGGLSPFEAFYLGTKAFVSDVPVLHELYENSAHYFEPDSAKDLAEKLNKYLDKKDSKKVLEKRKQRTIEHASFTIMADKIIERLKILNNI